MSDTTRNRYQVNETFFDSPESWGEAQAYWFGWLVSDGCNDKTERGISMRLAARDQEILETLKELIGYTGPVRIEKRDVVTEICGRPAKGSTHRAALMIYNRNLSQRVKELGIISGKASTFVLPPINPDSMHHFVRGLFDGDGCFCFTKYNHFESNLVGAPDMLESVRDWLLQQDITCIYSQLVYGNGAKTLRISGNNLGMKMFLSLYRDCHYFLPRKLSAFRKLHAFKGGSRIKIKEGILFNQFSTHLSLHEAQNPVSV